jgi:hypothetical protein
VRAAASLLALGLLVGVSCAHEDYKGPGEVIETSYDDPDDWFVQPIVIPGSTSCSSTGKTTSCHTTPPVIVPGHMAHDGPHWHVKIRGGDGHEHTLSVPEEMFNGCTVGMRWTYGEGCSLG